MNRKDYSAGAVKHSFWFMEFRKVGLSDDHLNSIIKTLMWRLSFC